MEQEVKQLQNDADGLRSLVELAVCGDEVGGDRVGSFGELILSLDGLLCLRRLLNGLNILLYGVDQKLIEFMIAGKLSLLTRF